MHRKRTKLTRSPHCGQYLMLFDAVSLTKKAEPPPTCDVNRDSGTASANGGWLRRLVRHRHSQLFGGQTTPSNSLGNCFGSTGQNNLMSKLSADSNSLSG